MTSISVQLPTFSTATPRGAEPLAALAALSGTAWRWAADRLAEQRRRRSDRAALIELETLVAMHRDSQPSMAADLRAAMDRSRPGHDAI